MKVKVSNRVNKDNYIIEVTDLSDARHWVINHRDSRLTWLVMPYTENKS